MKTIQRVMYVAFDGVEFENAPACKEWEDERSYKRLIGMTEEQVLAAIDREDLELAAAIERIGDRIKKARLEARDLKRQRKSEPSEPSSGEGGVEASPSSTELGVAAG